MADYQIKAERGKIGQRTQGQQTVEQDRPRKGNAVLEEIRAAVAEDRKAGGQGFGQ